MHKHIIYSVAFVLLVSGCTFHKLVSRKELLTPQFEYVSLEVKGIYEDHANVDFVLRAHNPNDIGLKNAYVSYELLTEGNRFLKGQDIRLELIPNGSSTLLVPAEIVYTDIFQALGPVLERIFVHGDYTVPVTINGIIYGKPTVYDEYEEGSLFSFEWKFSHTENISIPEDGIYNAIQMLFQQ